MKPLLEYLNERKTLYKSFNDAILANLNRLKEQNNVNISDSDLKKLADEIYRWYDEEGSFDDFDNPDEFYDYMVDDLLNMADAAEPKYQKLLYKLHGMEE